MNIKPYTVFNWGLAIFPLILILLVASMIYPSTKTLEVESVSAYVNRTINETSMSIVLNQEEYIRASEYLTQETFQYQWFSMAWVVITALALLILLPLGFLVFFYPWKNYFDDQKMRDFVKELKKEGLLHLHEKEEKK